MPQLDFSNPLTISQVVWMALIFGALYYVLARYALPGVGSVIEERAARINSDLETARQAKREADAAAAELGEAIRRASAEAQAAIARAMATTKAEAAEQALAETERLDAQLAEAEGRIAAARQSAMGALRDVANETARTVVTRLTGRDADAVHVGSAVDRALARQG